MIDFGNTIAKCTRLRDIAMHVEEGAYLAQHYRLEVNAIVDRQLAANRAALSLCLYSERP